MAHPNWHTNSGLSYFFADNIDTRKVLESIRDLVNVGNSYIQNNESRNRVLLKKTATFMTRIFNILGLNAKPEEIGFTSSTESAGNMEEVCFFSYATLKVS